MTRTVVWLHEAASEYREAVSWYDAVNPSLSKRFIAALESTVQAVNQFPLRFPIVDKGRRRAGVRRFPYGIFYLVEESRIVVIACFHGKRDPERWQNR